MNIVTATTEVSPIAKTGGLGDMVSFLSKEWVKQGHNAIIVLPKYKHIDTNKLGFQNLKRTLIVQMGYWTEFAGVWEGKLPGTEVKVYLVENNNYFNREGIYGDPNEFSDNDRRFIFFDKAVFEVCRAINFKPDILHAHDFHTGFSMSFLKEFYRQDPLFSKTAGVYTIHNLAHQGKFNPYTSLLYAGIPFNQFTPYSPYEYFGTVNAMKVGISYADKITTVSPNYSHEIMLPYYGEGLDGILKQHSADFMGILNGIDDTEWHPGRDKLIYKNFDKNYLEGKKENKLALLRDFGLNEGDDLDMPLISIITRLAEQKGVDLITDKMEELLSQNNFRFLVLASGDYKYEKYFEYLHHRFPRRVQIHIGYDNNLAHKIYAGSDFFLMPSRFEPCGLAQMFSLKYGTIPIVRETGGLADTVLEYDYHKQIGTGFTFWQYNSEDMAYAVKRALGIFNKQPHWDKIRQNAMEQNFSSEKTAQDYIQAFYWALEKVK
ncbi:MAG: hypothetical protein A2X64_03005 [Ignavibacteria bacterium GWF2_33_9]|nr:MAG: hypothetical protein A2X64_03005 [Ignavibacteria bacterium GWF2_33_9]